MRSDAHGTDLPSLATRASSGDADAFSVLVRETQHTTYRLALRMSGSESDAADVVQEAYLRAWEGLARLRDHTAILSWLCRIVRNVAADRVRQRVRHPTESLDRTPRGGVGALVEYLAADAPDPEECVASAEARAEIRAAIAELKEKHRVVLLLREVDGMSYAELATALGCPAGTIESRLHRARRELASKLRRRMRRRAREAA